MSFDLTGRLYKIDNRVYFGYNQVTVHDQRGRLFVKHNGKQINIKNIPILPKENDPVFDYIFEGGFTQYPCIAFDYWVLRWRLKYKYAKKK